MKTWPPHFTNSTHERKLATIRLGNLKLDVFKQTEYENPGRTIKSMFFRGYVNGKEVTMVFISGKYNQPDLNYKVFNGCKWPVFRTGNIACAVEKIKYVGGQNEICVMVMTKVKDRNGMHFSVKSGAE